MRIPAFALRAQEAPRPATVARPTPARESCSAARTASDVPGAGGGRRARGIGVLLLSLMLAGAIAPGHALAEEAPESEEPTSIWERDTLSGDWFGVRKTLESHGVAFGFDYTGEVMGVVAGGLHRRAVYLDNIDLTLTLELERLLGWKGASAFLYGLGDRGGSPSANVGDAQVVSNIDAPNTWKLYEAWLQQKLLDDKLSVLAGLYNLNGEFDVVDTAHVFLNSSHGIGKDYSQSGLGGPSIFPVTSVAARVKVTPSPAWYAQLAVLDGVAGNPRDPHGTQVVWHGSDGVLIASEVGHLEGADEASAVTPGKIALGSWYYTANFDHVAAAEPAGRPRREHGNFGIYGLVEQTLFHEADDPARGLAGWVRVGGANPRINQFGWYIGAGLVYRGPLPNRGQDQLGLAVANAINGGEFLRDARRIGDPVERVESAIELLYRVQITPWAYAQPDVQWVINPSTSRHIPDALVLGTRFGVSF